MHTIVITGRISPRISFHEEDFAAPPQSLVSGISQYGLVPLALSGLPSARISFHEEDFISSGVAPAVNYNLLMLMGVKT